MVTIVPYKGRINRNKGVHCHTFGAILCQLLDSQQPFTFDYFPLFVLNIYYNNGIYLTKNLLIVLNNIVIAQPL